MFLEFKVTIITSHGGDQKKLRKNLQEDLEFEVSHEL